MLIHGNIGEIYIGDTLIGTAIEWRADWTPNEPPAAIEAFPRLRTISGSLTLTATRTDIHGFYAMLRLMRLRRTGHTLNRAIRHAQAGRRRRGSNGWR